MDTGKQLAQVRPANTTAVSAYSPDPSIKTEVLMIMVCNTTGSSATFRLFHDVDGTTYDETTALYWDNSVNANASVQISYEEGSGLWLNNAAGNVAVRSGTGSALTFTLYGKENIA